VFVYEAYGPDQLRYRTGGPPEPQLLHSLDDVVSDFDGCEIEHAFEGVRAVNEGRLHRGDGFVVQVIARKRLRRLGSSRNNSAIPGGECRAPFRRIIRSGPKRMSPTSRWSSAQRLARPKP
jgi:hypothetical protein